jgi:hypothetical protein
MNSEEVGGMTRSFDELATGLDTGAISRGRAMKLAGAGLVASALGLVGARQADAQEDTDTPVEGERISKKKCRQKNGDYCKKSGCSQCCTKSNKKACCGDDGCRCCRRHQKCHNGKCGNKHH